MTGAGRGCGPAFAFVAAALLLRCVQLGTQPLWLDEALTAHIARAPDGLDFVHNTPPLYHWATRAWSTCFGIGPVALRSLSVLAGAAFVGLTFVTARAVFDRRTAAWAAAVATAAPLHLYYSQEARAYALLLAELMLVLWALWRYAAQGGFCTWLALVGASAAALYTHYLAAIPLAIAYVVIGVSAGGAGRWRTARAVALAGAVACAAVVPWLVLWSQRTPFAGSDMRWLELLWRQGSGPGAVAASLELFVLGPDAAHAPLFLKQFTSLAFPAVLRVAALLASGSLLGLALWRVRAAEAKARMAAWQVAALAAGPLLCLWGISVLRPVYAPGRYDLIAFPGFVLLAGRAIAVATAAPRFAWRAFAWCATAVLAVAVAAKDLAYFRSPAGPDPSRAVAAHLVAQLHEGDAVILTGNTGLPVLVHLYEHGWVWRAGRLRSAAGVECVCRLLPPALETAPAAASRYLAALEDGSLVTELQPLAQSLRGDRLWLVLGEELHGEHRQAPMVAIGEGMFRVLRAAGFELADGLPELGLARLQRR